MANLTPHMLEVLRVVAKGNEDGSFCDLDQVLERVAFETTKQSIQFTIRAMVSKDVLAKQGRERRRNRSRVVLSPTEKGYGLLRKSADDERELTALFSE